MRVSPGRPGRLARLVRGSDAWRWLTRTRRYADALRTIGTECETSTRPPFCSDPGSGRVRGAYYGAERWCDGCIAREALARGSDRR